MVAADHVQARDVDARVAGRGFEQGGVAEGDDVVVVAVDDEVGAGFESGDGVNGVEAFGDEESAERAGVVGGDFLPARECGEGDNRPDARLDGDEPEPDVAAERVAQQADAVGVDVGACEEVVERGPCVGDQVGAVEAAGRQVAAAIAAIVEQQDVEAVVGEEGAELVVVGQAPGVAVGDKDGGQAWRGRGICGGRGWRGGFARGELRGGVDGGSGGGCLLYTSPSPRD